MNNHEIEAFFEVQGLSEVVETTVRPPVQAWTLRGSGGRFPVLIQTQESADRMRIVAIIGDLSDFEPTILIPMLEANYHSALDARYALTDGQIVALFLHPFSELSLAQFVSGFYQVLHCTETFGTTFSGGTLTFGRTQPPQNNGAGPNHGPHEPPDNLLEALLDRLRPNESA